jgi:pimeloyl-ACP methyl ester carboxylesterase
MPDPEPSRFAAAAACVAALDERASHRRIRDVAWRIWGDGPPLILVHGDFGSWTHWLLNVEALARRFRVIAPDLPGYGDSASPAGPWTPADLAAPLAPGLAVLVPPPERYRLAGFSFGGIVAGHLAAGEGERVERLAVLGTNGLGLAPGPIPPLRRLTAGMTEDEVVAVHLANLNALMIADPARIDDLALHLQIENAARARVRAGDWPFSETLLEVLPAVRARLYGIWGGRDVLGGELAERETVLRRFDPDLDFRVIPGAGHWTPYEAPRAVEAMLVEMLG